MKTLYLAVDDELQGSQKLWRYMDLSKFVSLLDKNALWLARADTFRDVREGQFPEDMRTAIERAYEEFGSGVESIVRNADDFHDYLKKNTFISCWHKNLDENMVMWEIYGRDNSALAIQTTVDTMRDCINPSGLCGYSLILKDVSYQKSQEISGVLPYEECFFIKRPHFSFEQEVRISFDTYSRSKPSKKTPNGHYLPVFSNGLIKNILIHPDSPKWFEDAINSLTEKYDIHAPVGRGAYGNK